jgi:O-antigen ligase
MLEPDITTVPAVQRASTPRLPLVAGLFCALAIGLLAGVNIGIAIGFAASVVLLCLVVMQPLLLIPSLLLLSIFIEKAFQPLSISIGGKEVVNFNGIVNLCLIGATAFYVAMKRIRPAQSMLTKVFVVYLLAAALSLAVTENVFMTIKSLVRISAAYCIYLMFTQFLTEKRQIDKTFALLITISAIPIAVGLYQIAFASHFVLSRQMRTYGTLKNGMSYAMYLALILPYVAGQIFFSDARLAKRFLLVVLFLAGMVNLFYTDTRIGWGVFVAAMILYAAMSSARRLLPTIVVLTVAAVLAFFPFFYRSFGGLLKTDWRTYLSEDVSWYGKSESYIAASSLHIRVFVWRHMLIELSKHNLLLGAGSGTWYDNYDKEEIGFRIASHNDYFEVLFGAGLLGLAAYLVFRIRQLTMLAGFTRSGIDRGIKRMVLFPCLATHIACIGMSMTEVWQAYDGIYWLSWITIGISEAYYRWYRTHEQQPAEDESGSDDMPE